MTILSRTIRWRVECGRCKTAWAYPEGATEAAVMAELVGKGWRVEGEAHSCPRCARKRE